MRAIISDHYWLAAFRDSKEEEGASLILKKITNEQKGKIVKKVYQSSELVFASLREV